MNLHLVVLSSYSLGLMALGLWIGRRVPAQRTFSSPGAARSRPDLLDDAGGEHRRRIDGRRDTSRLLGGLAAWWWVGSAAIGSLVLALWIGPAMRRVAAAHDLRTVGDYLEFRYASGCAGSSPRCCGSARSSSSPAQLIAIGWILNVVAGMPTPVGCIVGGVVITVYFAAGGLLTSAWVNVVQLTVKLVGFALALPLALSAAGGWSAVGARPRRRRGLLDVLAAGRARPGLSGAARAGVHRLAGAAAEDVRRARRPRRAARRRPQRARAVALRERAGVLGMIAAGSFRSWRSRSGAADDADARRAAARRRAGPGGGVLGRDQRRGRGAVHAHHVAVTGSLQAVRPRRPRAPACCGWPAGPASSAARAASRWRSLGSVIECADDLLHLLGVSLFVPISPVCTSGEQHG